MRIRCFLAIDVGDVVRGELAKVIGRFRAVPADVRWVRDEGIHLTLAFLGSVEPARLADIREAATVAARGAGPIEIGVRGLDGFPNLRRPRVLWAKVRGSGLSELASAIEDELEPLGFQRRKRAFHPHITIGRMRSARGWTELSGLVHGAETMNFGTCKARAFHAYRSDLRRDGAVYTKLWTVEMGDDDGGIK